MAAFSSSVNLTGDASEFQKNISRNIKDILSILESPTGSPANTPVKEPPQFNSESGTPSKAPTPAPKSNILQGVVAYVEVRTTSDNRSRAIERELQSLGATICSNLAPEVTHVVFKDGKKSTRQRAEKRGLHLVSVLWLDRYCIIVVIHNHRMSFYFS